MHLSTCLEFAISPLLVAVSHLLNKTQVSALKTFVESMSVYAVLIAEPATGKSPAMNLIKKTLIKLEKYFNIAAIDSPRINR